MARTVLLMICLCCLLPRTILALDATVVDMKENVEVSNDMVILSDLADIRGKDAAMLSRIPIMKAPANRLGITLPVGFIIDKVHAEYRGSVDFRGAEQVLVKARFVEVSREVLEKVFIEQINSRNLWKDIGRVEIEQVRVPRTPMVREAGPMTIQANFSPHEDFLGLVSANLLISSGTSLDRVTVSARVRLMADVPVVRTRIRTGAMINSSDIILKNTDISSDPQQLCIKPEDCVGKRAKATLMEGKPIKTAQIEKKPDICSGDVVMIQARLNDLVVSDKGVALKDGHLGEPIPVKNVSSGKQVIGTIIADSLVQVEL
jgi:flagella basal body P-ring formation protein FlgA